MQNISYEHWRAFNKVTLTQLQLSPINVIQGKILKSRELLTTPILVVSNYTIKPIPGGKHHHSFTPESTSTIYEFEANSEPHLVQGERYNIGYEVINSRNIVDTSAIQKASDVDPVVSYYVSVQLGKQNQTLNTAKSDGRVVHGGVGDHLGKKYAWRIYGMCLARDTFEDYLAEIKHPMVICTTDGSPSIAYKNVGIDIAMATLIQSVKRISGNRFSSPLLPKRKWFTIKGIDAITEKK